MNITRHDIAEMLRKYLRHEVSLAALVSWAEEAVMEGELDPAHHDAIARLG